MKGRGRREECNGGSIQTEESGQRRSGETHVLWRESLPGRGACVGPREAEEPDDGAKGCTAGA